MLKLCLKVMLNRCGDIYCTFVMVWWWGVNVSACEVRMCPAMLVYSNYVCTYVCTVHVSTFLLCVRCIALSALSLLADPHYPWHSHHLHQPALDRPHTDVTSGAGCHGPSGKLFDASIPFQRHILQLLSSLSISQCDCSKVTTRCN